MRPGDIARGAMLKSALRAFMRGTAPLPGLPSVGAIDSLVEQIVDSLRRIEYVKLVHRMRHDPARRDPASPLFDPLIAAGLAQHAGDVDDACWLVFLSVHFGKHRQSGWQLSRDVYGALGAPRRWDWPAASADPLGFERWLHAHQAPLKPKGVVHFGNHRKYESLRPGPRGTASVVKSYVAWVIPHGGHPGLFRNAQIATGGGPGETFDYLYHSMGTVTSFGRMARFDYLTMVGKLMLAPVEPAIPYLTNATGPLKGARLLFGGNIHAALSAKALDVRVAELGANLGVGMQVMEDALCNWQKSPRKYLRFRG